METAASASAVAAAAHTAVAVKKPAVTRDDFGMYIQCLLVSLHQSSNNFYEPTGEEAEAGGSVSTAEQLGAVYKKECSTATPIDSAFESEQT